MNNFIREYYYQKNCEFQCQFCFNKLFTLIESIILMSSADNTLNYCFSSNDCENITVKANNDIITSGYLDLIGCIKNDVICVKCSEVLGIKLITINSFHHNLKDKILFDVGKLNCFISSNDNYSCENIKLINLNNKTVISEKESKGDILSSISSDIQGLNEEVIQSIDNIKKIKENLDLVSSSVDALISYHN